MDTTPVGRGRNLELQSGTYSDGHPLDEIQYLECKLILKPDRFTAAKVFFEYGDLVAQTAKKFGIDFINKDVVLKPQVREVLFLETSDFWLYNHAFILRRRIRYQDGFPTGDPEIALTTRCAASTLSRSSSSAKMNCAKRRWSVADSSSLHSSNPAATGSPSARPRPGSSTGSRAIRPRAMSETWVQTAS